MYHIVIFHHLQDGGLPLSNILMYFKTELEQLFLKGNEPCETSYADRAGKYMGQRGVTLPKL